MGKRSFVRFGELIGLYPKQIGRREIPSGWSGAVVLFSVLLLLLFWPQANSATHLAVDLQEIHARILSNSNSISQIQANVQNITEVLNPILAGGLRSALEQELGATVESTIKSLGVTVLVDKKIEPIKALVQKTQDEVNALKKEIMITSSKLEHTSNTSLLLLLCLTALATTAVGALVLSIL